MLKKIILFYLGFISFTLSLISCSDLKGSASKSEETSFDKSGMVYFEGGEITIGLDKGYSNEIPAHKVNLEPFYFDKHPVTVAQFRLFIEATGYKTEAEKFGNSLVWSKDSLIENCSDQYGRPMDRTQQPICQGWFIKEGANWQYPFGPDESKAIDNHPVTQVSWNDATAYAKWAGKRLPTEEEWEYAAKNGDDKYYDQYSWGKELVDSTSGEYKANVWQGNFPFNNSGSDAFFGTSPVGVFGQTEAGLTDMGGNVWEWCQDTYQMYKGSPAYFNYNPNEKVIRGGSFLCDPKVCHGYRVTSRNHCTKETGSVHSGFRCAASSM